MADNRPEIVLDANITPFRQAMAAAASELKRVGAESEGAFSRMAGPLGALQSKFLAIGALLGGGKVFGAAVDEAKKLAGEAGMLSKALSIGTTEASALNVALGDIGAGAEDFVGAAQQLSRQLRTNEDDLNALGLRTREANGEYRNMKDLMFDAVRVLNGYKEGTDRTLAAQAMFGKGAGEVGKLLKLQAGALEEADEKARSLGLTIGVQNVEAVKAYKASMNDVGDVLSALKKAIGDAVMPVLTELGNWFSAIGPAAVVVIKGAVGGLVALFWGLRTTVVMVFEAIDAAVKTVIRPLWGVSAAIDKLVHGDVAGAAEELKNIPRAVGDAWSGSLDRVVREATEARDKLWNLFANPDDALGKAGSGKGYKPPADKGGKGQGSKEADPSFMQYYETLLAERKNAYEQENVLREFGKEQELAYWRELQQGLELTSKDRLAIAKRTATLELEIRRQQLKDQQDLDAAMIDSGRAASLALIERLEQAAKFARENGEITKANLLDQELEYASLRFEIEKQALLERLEMAENDPGSSPAALAQIRERMLEIERNYQLRRGEILQNKKKEEGKIWLDLGSRMSGLWDKGLQAMMNGTLRWRNAWRAIGMEMVSWFANSVIGNMVKDWLAGEAKKLAVKLGLLEAEKTADKAASAVTVATKTAETGVVVAENAAQAGTGAAASQAGIPIVGPMLALAAMAAIFAAVMSMGGKRKSAAGGFDIPRGLNPLTQLHEEEMVLPSQYANVIRGMAAGDGQGGGDPVVVNLNFNGLYQDRAGIKRFFADNHDAVMASIKKSARIHHRD